MATNTDQSIGGATKAEMAASPTSPQGNTINAPPATHQPMANTDRAARFSRSPMSYLWALVVFIIFGLAVAELGINGHLQAVYHGTGWAGLHRLRRTVGLLVFTSAFTIVWAISTFWLPLLFNWIWVIVLMCFWIVAAGLLNHSEPYRIHRCSRFGFPSMFNRSCHQFVASEVLAWWLWAMFFMTMIGLIFSLFSGDFDRRKRTMYNAHFV